MGKRKRWSVALIAVLGLALVPWVGAQAARPTKHWGHPGNGQGSSGKGGKLLFFASDGLRQDAVERYASQGVVPGFSEALKLMSKGAKYRFWIKPSLAYGNKTTGPIPANSVLVFDLELLDFLPESVIRQMQAQQQQMQGAIPPGAGAVPGAGAIPGGPPPGQ